MKSSASKIQMTSFDDLFKKSGAASSNKDGVQEIALSELHPFKNHPFKVLDDEDMQKLVDSIQENGVLMPAIVRHRVEGGYEMIAGHRRCHACEIAGLATMPVIISDLDDYQATIVMVDSNIQRPNILPSERAFAYKMKLEAMKRQAGRPSKENDSQLGNNFSGKKSSEILAEQVGESKNQIFRFIRLTELITPLLDMVDGKKLALNSAVELSYLKKEEQANLLGIMEMEETVPSLSQAQRLKKFSQGGKLTEEVMDAILTEGKEEPAKITLRGAKLGKYFPTSYTPAQIENVIFSLLDKWKKDQGQDSTV